MMETGESKPKEPAPKLSRWWIGGPLLGLLLVISGMLGRQAWQDHQFEKERTETPPHVVEDLKLKLLWIPAGTFTMGTDGEAEWLKSLKQKYNEVKPSGWDDWKFREVAAAETPAHVVTLTKGFYLGETEVTQAQWEAVIGSNPSYIKGTKQAIEEVSWNDCMEFCRKLTERERVAGRLGSKQAFRLPTEAEWEYACRAGSRQDFCFGGDESRLGEFAWFNGNSEFKRHEIGTKRSNAWGFHDMHGNAWEWCADLYGSYPGGEVADPTGAGTGDKRVNRGGSAWVVAPSCRSANRNGSDSSLQNGDLSFRLVLSPIP